MVGRLLCYSVKVVLQSHDGCLEYGVSLAKISRVFLRYRAIDLLCQLGVLFRIKICHCSILTKVDYAHIWQ